jgi:hypothetical protein
MIENSDPVDGVKAIGCLLVGVCVLACMVVLGNWIINSIR